MSVLVAILSFIVALGVLVTIHEYGHFWVARRVGVKVLRFSVGFGRPLWSRLGKDGTEYVVAAIPLGGYVRMLDERDDDLPIGTNMSHAFNRAKPVHKIAISAAGPAANFLFAVFAYWLMFIIGMPGIKPIVGEPLMESPAAMAGVEAGDQLVRVAGTGTPTWEAANLALLDAVISGEPFSLVVVGQDGFERTLTLAVETSRALTEPGALLPGLGLRLWQPVLPPVLGELEPGGAAERSGLYPGDEVVTFDAQEVGDWMSLVGLIQAAPDRQVSLGIVREGVHMMIQVPVGVSESGVGRLGAGVQVPEGLFDGMQAEQRFGPLEAIPRSLARTVDMSWLTLKMLGRMIIGEVSVKNISGPINIAQYAGYTASIGLIYFLGFMAIVSISLGIINLLPIPILDGGHLLYHLAELVRGKPVPERVEAVGQRIGLGMLAMLMGLAIFNDLARLFG